MIDKIIFFCILCASQSCIADVETQKFSREVLLDQQTQLTLSAIQLDSNVYMNSATDFSDLRLINQDGEQTPYLLQKITTIKSIPVIRRQAVPGKITELQKSTAEGFEIILTVDKDTLDVDGLSIVTAQKNFEYELTVLGSDDTEHWQTIVEHAVIYDYSQFMDFNNRDIELPKNHYRYFKMIVFKTAMTQHSALTQLTTTLKGDQEQQREETITLQRKPLHIDQIKLWHKQVETSTRTEQLFDYPLTDFTVHQNKQHKTTEIDINAFLLPIRNITLDISTQNFSRTAEVQTFVQQGNETHIWNLVRGKLEALHFKNFRRKQLTLNFSTQRQKTYRIVIHNQDNPALRIAAISASGPGYELLFLAQPNQGYQLLYDGNSTEKPHYDIVPIQELLQKGFKSTTLTLGDVKIRPAEEKAFKSDDFVELLNSDLFLGLMISLMVLVLGWSLYRVSKQIGKLDEPPE